MFRFVLSVWPPCFAKVPGRSALKSDAIPEARQLDVCGCVGFLVGASNLQLQPP